MGIVSAKDPFPPPKKKSPNYNRLPDTLPLFYLYSIIALLLAITVLLACIAWCVYVFLYACCALFLLCGRVGHRLYITLYMANLT